jgi:hypothetical protein
MNNLCPSCYLDSLPAGLGLDPLYPGDIVEVIKDDENKEMRGTVTACSCAWHRVDVWVQLKPDRDSDPYYVSYARDDVRLFSRFCAGQSQPTSSNCRFHRV